MIPSYDPRFLGSAVEQLGTGLGRQDGRNRERSIGVLRCHLKVIIKDILVVDHHQPNCTGGLGTACHGLELFLSTLGHHNFSTGVPPRSAPVGISFIEEQGCFAKDTNLQLLAFQQPLWPVGMNTGHRLLVLKLQVVAGLQRSHGGWLRPIVRGLKHHPMGSYGCSPLSLKRASPGSTLPPVGAREEDQLCKSMGESQWIMFGIPWYLSGPPKQGSKQELPGCYPFLNG